MDRERFIYLIHKYVSQEISGEEAAELKQLLAGQDQPELQDALGDAWLTATELPVPEPGKEELQGKIDAIISIDRPVEHRVHFLRRWRWAAACILMLMAAGTYWWWSQPQPQNNTTVQHLQDIAPGRDGAVLTLADGTEIVLDSLGNGVVARQNGAQVVLEDGQLAYDPSGEAAGSTVFNAITTPKGRQFRVTLPDQTRVWLNAASSIRYPTTFTGNERRVEITGEAYLEVAQHAEMPFRVVINKKATIEVLGTHFNVNAYKNEPHLNATLLEGSIRVIAGEQSAVLKPGQQARVSKQIKVVPDADLAKVIAWKNGLFNFQDLSFQEAARQLERWYNIQVIYEGKVPDIRFQGEMDRGVNLSGVVKLLSVFGVKTRIEGRKLIVL